MIILGNGLTAAIALHVFPDATAYYDEDNKSSRHEAILRFRTNNISDLTGIPFKRVTIYKGIHDGEYFVPPSIKAMNIYSEKTTGGIYKRSISNIDPVDRFIAPKDFYDQIMNNVKGRIQATHSIKTLIRANKTNTITSTLPMKKNIELFNIETDNEHKYQQSCIYVNKLEIDNCNVYQTIYNINCMSNVYRSSIEGNVLTIESMAPLEKNDILDIMPSFFIGNYKEWTLENYPQLIGKIVEIEEGKRQKIITDLTAQRGVYSLGRVACWRPSVLLDDVLNDCYKIKDMIELTPYKRAMIWK